MVLCHILIEVVILCVLTMLTSLQSFSYVNDVLKPQFQRDFTKTCMKYPFALEFIKRLKNPNGRSVVFVFQQPGLRNGGFGDRIAGLITATGLAMRYNRTLIIRAQNDFFKLFRPYTHPSSSGDRDANKYTYNLSEIEGWAKYGKLYENNDNTELDLWNCINTNFKNCAMLYEDPNQPNILLRGNRAYMCRWFNCDTGVPAKQELTKMLGIGNEDLMEAAGCMLRLAMWPTDLLWTMVDEVFESHKRDLKRRGLVKHHDQALLWRYLVSTHFRCGDLGYIHGESYDLACQHSYQYNVTMNGTTQLVYNIPPHQESGYMGYATPIDIAQCAARVLENMTAESMRSWDSFLNQAAGHSLRRADNSTPANLTMDYRTIVHIASDNPGGAKQINETLLWPNTLLSPSGCHIEMDASYECLQMTALYWFVMANSDVIVSPGVHGITNSGFSRYAAVYGLKKDSLRDPKQCDNILTTHDLSHIQHNNWFC
jgi:hypothetical protein